MLLLPGMLLLAGGWLLGTESGNLRLLQWTVGEQLHIGSLKGSLLGKLQLGQLDYRDTQLQLKIETLQLQWRPTALWQGLLHIEQLQVQGISYRASQQSQNGEDTSPPLLPIAIRLDKASMNDIRIQEGDDIVEIQRIALSATARQQQININSIEIDYDSYSATASGQLNLSKLYPYSLQLDWHGDMPEFAAASGKASITGDSKGLAIEHVTSKPFIISTNGHIEFDEDATSLDLHGEWQQISWPLQSAVIQAQAGRYQLSGALQHPLLQANTTLRFPDSQIPGMQASLQGQIHANGINDLQFEATVLDGKLNATGQITWLPQFAADLAISGETLDPSVQWHDWPGKLSLQAMLQMGMDGQGFWLQGNLKQLSGTLQQQPVSANGSGRYDHQGIELQSVQLHSGPNRLQLQGHIAESLDLDYVLHAPDLAAFWPALKGQIEAEGQLAGNRDQPEITTTVQASKLAYADYGIAQLNGKLRWDQGQANGKLNATALRSGDWRAQQLSLDISGTPQQHEAQLSLVAPDLQIKTRLAGGWQAPLWRGQIQQLHIHEKQTGQWENTTAANLQAGNGQFNLQMLCLQQDKASLCSNMQWQPQDTRIDAQLTTLPLKFFSSWLPEPVSLEGEINGALQLHGPTTALQGEARLELPQGMLRLHNNEDQPLQMSLRDGAVRFQMSPDHNRAELQLKAGNGEIAANLQTAALDLNNATPVSGKLNAQLPDLQAFGPLLPGLSDIQGQLIAQADISGNLRQPEIQGYMDLNNAAATVPQLGIALQDIHLSARNQGVERLLLQGEMKSGGGLLKLNGDLLLDATQGWPLALELQGQDFQFVRLPEAVAFASPDLDIRLSKKHRGINGKLALPKADIRIKQLPKTAVGVSDDEIIVGKVESQTAEPPLELEARVEIQVGDQVHFDGFGLNTRLVGKVDLHSQQGRNLAQGELQLKEGSYKAYGQDLSIKQGRVLFNGPPQNPNLDIQATRLSKDESVTAILNLSGSLQKPLVQVSSTPSLPEEEALAYLLTGQGLDAKSPGTGVLLRQALASKGLEKSQQILDQLAQGLGVDEVSLQEGGSLEETSLLLGKYLSPDLYVSYAVGLFDNQGALVTRYRLSKRLRLEVQSGAAQSMDLIYDVEK
jgi:translocation and assembly module TamB